MGTIDILAQETPSNAFVVVELKKGRESDKVVGQVLRYMGRVTENLCQQGQDVKGMIVCKESDPRISYAIQMARDCRASSGDSHLAHSASLCDGFRLRMGTKWGTAA